MNNKFLMINVYTVRVFDLGLWLPSYIDMIKFRFGTVFLSVNINDFL